MAERSSRLRIHVQFYLDWSESTILAISSIHLGGFALTWLRRVIIGECAIEKGFLAAREVQNRGFLAYYSLCYSSIPHRLFRVTMNYQPLSSGY